MNAPTEILRAAMRRAGLDYAGPLAADGRLHRIKCGEDRERNSWYVLHAGPPGAGSFGCWKRGFKETWHERNGQLSQAEWSRVREHWRHADAERERAETEGHAKARRTADWILAHATPADPSHPYAARKGVGVHGELRQWRGAIVLPMRDAAGELHTLQFIGADGAKRFLRGGRVAGCFYTVADKPDGPLVLAEGFATAASVHEATGFATVAAMNAGNLKAVAVSLRAAWPQREIVVAADNDQFTDGNPGAVKATEAAKAVGGKLAAPQFADLATKPTDFNDLALVAGLAEVNRQIETAAVPTETPEDVFARLAGLSAVDYDRSRAAEADKLGIRTGTLDAEVAKLRPQTADDAQGTAVEFPDVAPWPEAVDGAGALAEVSRAFRRYILLPDGAAAALALWVAHAHGFGAFLHTPRLNLCSPEKGCGKTTLLDVIASLVPRPLRTESLTVAVLFRLIEKFKPTLLLDEVDAFLPEAEELRGLLNAGHKRGAKAYRCDGESNEVRGFNAFAPAVLAGIGALPGTLHDRSIVVKLVRAKPGEVAARFNSRRTGPENELCRKLARWTADNSERLEACDPRLPANAFNRLADNWRPLFAVAEVAGGDWPRRVADAFGKLTTGDDLDAQGIGATLLGDIAEAFAADGADRLPSAKLAQTLAANEGRPWAEYGKARKPISPNQLANLLRRFGIAPRTIRVGDETPKGYALDDFADAFGRFLPKPPFPDRHTATKPENIGDPAVSDPPQPEGVLRIENAVPINEDKACGGVADRNTPDAEKELVIRL